MKNRLFGFVFALVLVFVLTGCDQTAGKQKAAVSGGKNYVVWVSLDGLRPDYVERAPAPFIQRLMSEGAYSRLLTPTFPTITFASHSTEATGVTVSGHGIPVNDFYDVESGQTLVFPTDPKYLRAEPIWNAATRQGLRAGVLDWPMSQHQTGPNAAAVFNPEKFDGKKKDSDRAEWIWTTWHSNAPQFPLRLLMGYMEATDKPGHKYGPDAPETPAVLKVDDALLESVFTRIYADFQMWKKPEDHLYFLITTDHGMLPVTHFVNIRLLLDLKGQQLTDPSSDSPATQPVRALYNYRGTGDVVAMTSGNIANIYVKGDDRAATIEALMAKLKTVSVLQAYHYGQTPKKWAYDSLGHTGDILVVLNNGYTFSTKLKEAIAPRPEELAPKGMHGYVVEQCPEMHGLLVIWRDGKPMGGKDLGEISTLRITPTVAGWLGIQVPNAAKGKPIELPE